MNSPLLTIAIPTYNRAFFLDRCLNQLYTQLRLSGESELIELIVSDNCSTDSTNEVVSNYIKKGLKIKYIQNSENLGADYNIAQCYLTAKGRYMLCLGDDDLLVTGAIDVLIGLLSQGTEFGIVYMSSYGITDFIDKPVDPRAIVYKIYKQKNNFLRSITYKVTFISGNIINRKALDNLSIYEANGTNLIQVPVILNAFDKFSTHAIITTNLLASQIENTGGYNLFQVFGVNFYRILSSIFKDGNGDSRKNIIIKDMLIKFFPYWIHRLKSKNSFNSEEVEAYRLMKPLYKNYLYFWIFNYPIIIAPRYISSFFLKGTHLYSTILNKAYNIKDSLNRNIIKGNGIG